MSEFKIFRSGDFSLKDNQRSGFLKVIIEMNRHITVREIAKHLNVSHTTIENHVRRFGLVKKLDI